ncbi:hypothetical protein F0562_026227 [Nyssa sinensis]|uniref:Uncharacterized protein n=1 Tax=Nyssa sinensis TaxID=561372 RepID=A0A5J5B8G5_9ASTE|nr:hypothetical protein F0562_026227 [Nyssa sinensis]
MATEAAAVDQKAKLRPAAMRTFTVPIPPPWDSVRFALDKKLHRSGDVQTCFEVLIGKNLDSGNRGTAGVGPHGVSFEGFVARASCTLSEFLNNISGNLIGDQLVLSHLGLFEEARSEWRGLYARQCYMLTLRKSSGMQCNACEAEEEGDICSC